MATDKEIKDFPIIIGSEFDTSKDLFLLPGDGSVHPTSTVIADAVLDNLKKQQGLVNHKQIKSLNLFSFWDGFKLSAASTNIVDEWSGLRQESSIRTYDLSNLGIPDNTKAVYVKIFIHGSYPALHMTYYKSSTATSGHTMNNLRKGKSRAAAEAWQLWMPVNEKKIFIKWRYTRATGVSGDPSIVQLMVSSYI